jgi:putative methyltransferase (TIGR04325 family)
MAGTELSVDMKFFVRETLSGLRRLGRPFRAAKGRLRYFLPFPRHFTGAYTSYDEALAAAKTMSLAGYDHDEVATVSFEKMCQVALWDYPVLFWMRQLMGEVDGVLDAGGHMGTKYRAFRPLLPIDDSFRWVVYDLPAIVRAGRKQAAADGLTNLSFVERIEDAGALPLFLGSGLMQYLDMSLTELLHKLPAPPKHMILNKVAFSSGRPIVTLEKIGRAYVPYQMRDRNAFLREIRELGYELVDTWSIPAFSHMIETHPELGTSESVGFYFRRG